MAKNCHAPPQLRLHAIGTAQHSQCIRRINPAGVDGQSTGRPAAMLEGSRIRIVAFVFFFH